MSSPNDPPAHAICAYAWAKPFGAGALSPWPRRGWLASLGWLTSLGWLGWLGWLVAFGRVFLSAASSSSSSSSSFGWWPPRRPLLRGCPAQAALLATDGHGPTRYGGRHLAPGGRPQTWIKPHPVWCIVRASCMRNGSPDRSSTMGNGLETDAARQKQMATHNHWR